MKSTLLQLPLRRPLVSSETARTVLDRDEDYVLGLVQDGKLRFAWNVATLEKRRATVRILTLSLIDFALGTSSQPETEDDALRYVLPGVTPEVRGSTLQRALNTGASHIANLVRCGCLQQARPLKWKTETPPIVRASAVKFLKLRRMP